MAALITRQPFPLPQPTRRIVTLRRPTAESTTTIKRRTPRRARRPPLRHTLPAALSVAGPVVQAVRLLAVAGAAALPVAVALVLVAGFGVTEGWAGVGFVAGGGVGVGGVVVVVVDFAGDGVACAGEEAEFDEAHGCECDLLEVLMGDGVDGGGIEKVNLFKLVMRRYCNSSCLCVVEMMFVAYELVG